jgi:osmotically inducible protein OsmC
VQHKEESMPVRKATAEWQGRLRDGRGKMRLGSGAFEGAYSFASRFAEGEGTNPEELIGAAHAGCFSMAFAGMLEKAGHTPERIRTTASVAVERVGDGFSITKSRLSTEGKVPGIDEATFREIAEQAKAGCPVSRALQGVEISLEATLES